MVDFGPSDDFGSPDPSIYWWLKSKKSDALQALNADFKHLSTDNQRIEAYETYASLYTNRSLDMGNSFYGTIEDGWTVTRGKYTRCPYNLMKQVIDDVTARIIKTQPRAKFLTHGGNRSLKRKAKLMEKWNDHLVHKLRQDEKFNQVIKDACIYGLGALKIGKAYKRPEVTAERVYPGNLYVDLQETAFAEPTRLHHRTFVSKEWLKMMFPKQARDIESSGAISDAARYIGYYDNHQGSLDQVELVESWHLPSYVEDDGTPSKDGVRYLWCDKVLLQTSTWSRRSFPIAFFRWKQDPTNTFYGVGLGEDLFGVHVDANLTLNRVNTAIELMPNPYVLIRKGTETDIVDISNAPGTFIEWSGPEPPQIVLPQSVPGDLLQYVREHEMRAYKIAGLSSQEQEPDSLQTGRAVEMHYQTGNVPFVHQLAKFEFLVQDVGECNVATGRHIYDVHGKFSVLLDGDRKNTIQELDWSEVAIDPRENSYVIRAEPVSALSDTFAARLSEVERLQMMFPNMPEQKKKSLLGMPDMENEEDLGESALNNIDKMIEAALDDGEFTAPSPFMDLDLLIIRGNEAEQKAADEDVAENNRQVLRMMIRAANGMRQKQIMAAQLQQQGMATPAAVPQSPQSGQGPTAITG